MSLCMENSRLQYDLPKPSISVVCAPHVFEKIGPEIHPIDSVGGMCYLACYQVYGYAPMMHLCTLFACKYTSIACWTSPLKLRHNRQVI